MTEVLPSILSADFARLGEQVDEVVAAGATVIHVDVMDGHFVPPITMGPIVVSALRDRLDDAIDLDVHLMIERPERQVEAFASAGASGITVHAEATPHVHYALNEIRERGCRAGLALNPATPLDHLRQVRPDLALVMTVNPGWGGQAFIAQSPQRVTRAHELLSDHDGDAVLLQVDGGVDAGTAPRCVAAGARWLVAGSAVFGADDPGAAYAAIVDAAAS